MNVHASTVLIAPLVMADLVDYVPPPRRTNETTIFFSARK